MRKYYNTLILGAAFITLVATGETTSGEQLSDILNKNDFIALKTPSNFYKPGAIIYRKKYDSGIVTPKEASLGHLCSDEYTIIKYASSPISSKSENIELIKFNKSSVEFDLPVLKELMEANAGISHEINSTFVVDKVELKSFALDDLLRIRRLMGPILRMQI